MVTQLTYINDDLKGIAIFLVAEMHAKAVAP